MEKQNEQLLRKLPSVDGLLKDPDLDSFVAEVGRKVVADSIRLAIDEVRELLLAKTAPEMDETTIRQKIIADTKRRVKAVMRPYYRRVVNATGIILHTGLGRAVLPSKALRQIQNELSGYSLLHQQGRTLYQSTGKWGILHSRWMDRFTSSKVSAVGKAAKHCHSSRFA